MVVVTGTVKHLHMAERSEVLNLAADGVTAYQGLLHDLRLGFEAASAPVAIAAA